MNVKPLLRKTLLAVALLGAGSSAWAAKSVVGALDNSATWWSAFSDYYTIAQDESLTLTFTNYSSKGKTYQNWIGFVTNDVDRQGTGYAEYLGLRADGFQMGNAKVADIAHTYSEGIGIPSDNAEPSISNTTLMDILDGANVILKVTRSGATVTLRYDFTTTGGTEYFQQAVFDVPDASQTLRFFLVTEGGHIENLCEGAWTNVETRNFDDADTFTSGFGVAKGLDISSISPNQITRYSGSALYGTGNGSRTTDVYYQLSNTDFRSAVGWKIECDLAFQASSSTGQNEFFLYDNYSYSNHSYGRMTGVTKYLMIAEPTSSTTITIYKGNDTTDPISTTLSADGYKKGADLSLTNWYHYVFTGIPDDGIYLSVQSTNGESVIGAVKVSDYAVPGGFSMAMGRNNGRVAIDNLKIYTQVQPVVTTKFQLSDGTTLINSIETQVVSGSSFTPVYPASFQSGTKQYTYVSGGDEIASVTADRTVTIVYSETDMPTGTFYAETYEKNGGTAGWTSGTGGRYTPVILGDITNGYLSVNQGERNNQGTTVTGTAFSGKVAANTDFTMSFDIQLTNAGNNTNETSRVSIFTIKDVAGIAAMLNIAGTANGANTWVVNNDTENPIALTAGTWYTMQYSRKGSLTYLAITPTAGGDAVLTQTQISTISDDGGLGEVTFTTNRYNANIALDNVLIRAWQTGDTPEVTETTYTIQYRDESGNEIKDDVVNPTTVGAEDIVASAAETASFYNDGRTKKYIFKEGNDPITAVADAASNVITLVFREAATYSYTVTNNLGTVLASTSAFEQDEIVQPYPRYELKDGTMYTKGATSNEYRVRFTLTEDNQTETIDGYDAANIDNVVFYTEGENISGAEISTAGTRSTRSSNGAVGNNPTPAELTVCNSLAPGKYKICVAFIKENSNNVTASFQIGETTYNATTNTSGTNLQGAETEEFIVTTATDVLWTNNCNLDYVYIQKTGDVVSFTLGEASGDSYRSFVTTGNTDFEALGLTAFVASAADTEKGVVTLKTIDNAPAGVPVLLKATQGTQAVVTTTSTVYEAPETNYLAAADGTTAIAAADAKYVLAYTNDNWEFRHYNGTLSAGKVYLDLSEVAGANNAVFGFVFDDESTGIDAISQQHQSDQTAVYNLNGQRVAQPAKGFYIIRSAEGRQQGKKLFIK